MQSWPLVSVVILNWNGLRHLQYCLPSVLATDYPRCQLILVDNASNDGSCEYVQSAFPQLVLLRNERNLGWSGGNNVGIRFALARGARHIVLLNNDIKVHPQWLREAVAVAEADARTGIVGFQVFGEYGKEPIERFEEACRAWKTASARPADHVEARARRAGFALARVNVPIWHYSEGSWGRVQWKASILTMRNRIRYLIKNEGLVALLRETAKVAHVSCNPFARISPGFAFHRRLRPSNVLVNAGLLAYALGWNIARLPQTLAARRRDNQAIAAYLKGTAQAPGAGHASGRTASP